ncbi:hypothetical protein SAMN05518672_104381 [Chitinophaga sp. CF118]|nr:hypothetical protein SAMN05518672_104381 [Chitinophaga sp. CF118]
MPVGLHQVLEEKETASYLLFPADRTLFVSVMDAFIDKAKLQSIME